MEDNHLWSESIKIRAFMVDKNRVANFVTLQNLCQDVAGNHAQANGLGYTDMQARGSAWVLNRLKMTISDYPKWTETVTVQTWVSVMEPFSHRHFQIVLPASATHETEMILANVYSIWIPIDLVTRKPKRLSNHEFLVHQRAYDCEIPEKLAPNEDALFSSERIVQYADVDMIGHVNNTKYVEWLLDDFFRENKNKTPKSLDINYLGEIFEGDTVAIFVKKIDNVVIYAMKNKGDGKDVCRAKLLVF